MADPAQRAADLPEPKHHNFGRYELLFRLAVGGMAELYVGRLRGLSGFEKLLVVKLITAEYTQESTFVKMFIDEARLAARIAHPNVVQVLELGRAEPHYYIAMEYVHGESLGATLRYAGLPLPLAVRVVSDAAAGLHAAHELRDHDGRSLEVVHRDVSPSNILISYEGMVKVTDFGVARALSNLNVSRVGIIKGKVSYMAPEYLESQAVDRRSDIFGLGAVLYEATTGRRLYPRGLEDRRGSIIPPSLIVEGYPDALEQIVLKALHRDPDLRFQTALELKEKLEQFIVDTGAPALNSALGELMCATFADRIEKKKALIAGTGDEDTLAAIVETGTRSPTLQGQTVSKPKGSWLRRLNQRPRLVLASGLLLLASLCALIIYVLLPARPRAPLPPPARAAARPPKPKANAAAARAKPAAKAVAKVAPRPDRGPDVSASATATVDARLVSLKSRSGQPRLRWFDVPVRPAPSRRPKAIATTSAGAPDRPHRKRLVKSRTKPAASPERGDDLFGNPFKQP